MHTVMQELQGGNLLNKAQNYLSESKVMNANLKEMMQALALNQVIPIRPNVNVWSTHVTLKKFEISLRLLRELKKDFKLYTGNSDTLIK